MSKIQPGNGYGFTSSGYGFSINTESPFNDPEQGEYRPLFCTYNGTNKYLISPGTVNRIVPRIGSVYLDAATKPELTVTGNGYICVMLTHETDSFFPRTATIILHPGAVTPVDSETIGYWPLAKVNITETEAGTTYETIPFSYGNLVCNRLKAGDNTAVWYWAAINSQPSA